MIPEQQALEMLETELAAKEADVAHLRRVVEQLRERVHAGAPRAQASSQEYAGMGVTEAVRAFLGKSGQPKTTREIVDALMDRGIRSRSRKLTASVYATLTNAKKEFERFEGAWRLKEVTENNTER